MVEKRGRKKEKKEISGEIPEIFEIEKDGKKKTIELYGKEEEKTPSKEQIKKESKIFRNVIIVMIGLVFMFFAVYIIIYFSKHFEVGGVNFEVIKMGRLTFYTTSLPVLYEGKDADYNFYLRSDPRVLENIEFNGEITIKKDMVLNMTKDFNCDGDGIIAVANLLKVYNIIGTEVIKDQNATCDDIYGRYMWVNIKEGNETKITEFGFNGGCYNIYIKDCEILKGTEKFLVETFAEVNKRLEE